MQGGSGRVEIGDEQLSQFEVRHGVQECEDPDGRLVGVDAGVCAPAAEQAALLDQAERLAVEAMAGHSGQVPGRVDEHELVLAGPPEELSCGLEPTPSVGRTLPQEHFDVADIDGGPVVLGSLAGQEAGQVSDDAQGLFDRVVRTRAGPRPSGALTGTDQVVGERSDRRPEGRRRGVDTTLPAPVGQTGFLIQAERQVLGDEELLEGPRKRPR